MYLECSRVKSQGVCVCVCVCTCQAGVCVFFILVGCEVSFRCVTCVSNENYHEVFFSKPHNIRYVFRLLNVK